MIDLQSTTKNIGAPKMQNIFLFTFKSLFTISIALHRVITLPTLQ